MLSHEEIIGFHHRRFATKKFDSTKKIPSKDWETIVEVGRLSPSSLGLEPWKILLISNQDIKEKLKPLSWGAVNSLEGASHFIIILARKGVTYDSPYVKDTLENVKGHPYDKESQFAQRIKSYQENDAKLVDSRSLLDWSSKQTYILLANMMTAAAMLDIDSCPIEGFDHEAVETLLSEHGLIDLNHFGISLMAGFGYKNQEVTPKTRRQLSDVYQVVE